MSVKERGGMHGTVAHWTNELRSKSFYDLPSNHHYAKVSLGQTVSAKFPFKSRVYVNRNPHGCAVAS
jgi:hypothetical protein